MVKKGFRPSPSGGKAEQPHPKLCVLFPLGDGTNEIDWLWVNTIDGTVIDGAFSGSKARNFAYGLHGSLGNAATLAYPWTFMFYIQLYNSNVTAYLFRSDVQIKVTPTDISVTNYAGSTTYAQASASLNLNTWYHIAVSCGSAAGQWKMWLNGSALSLSTNGSAINLGYITTNQAYLIYVYPNGTNAALDHVKAYRVQLSDIEVVTEMNKKVW